MSQPPPGPTTAHQPTPSEPIRLALWRDLALVAVAAAGVGLQLTILRPMLEAVLDAWYGPVTALSIVVVALIVGAFVLRPRIQRRRQCRRLVRWAAARPRVEPGPFRLDPYTSSQRDRDAFHRTDRVHEEIFAWLCETTEPVLYLSGPAGVGKSSLLNAYALPNFARTYSLPVPADEEPMAAIGRRLLAPGEIWRHPAHASGRSGYELLVAAAEQLQTGGRRLLLVFDDFEQRLIDGDVASCTMLLHTLAERPIDAVATLIVVTSDHVDALRGLDLPPLVPGRNWREVPAFTETEGVAFLTRGGVREDIASALARSAADEPGAEGGVRPITLNLLGLVTHRAPLAVAHTASRLGDAGGLVGRHLGRWIRTPLVRDQAPPLLRAAITPDGRRRRRRGADLAARAGLPRIVAAAGLVWLETAGLLRQTEDGRWEVPHDVIARRLRGVLDRERRSPGRLLRPWLAPLAVLAWLVLFVATPAAQIKRERVEWETAFRAAGGQFVTIEGHQWAAFEAPEGVTESALKHLTREPGLYGVNLTGLFTSELTLPRALTRLPISSLVLAEGFVSDEDLARLDGTHLTELILAGCEEVTEQGLAHLRNLPLRTLDLRRTQVADLGPLAELTTLERIDVSATPIAEVGPLATLTNLQWLDLGDTSVSDLTPLADLPRLRSLSLYSTRVSDLSPLADLESLESLDLLYTLAADLTPLAGLAELRSLSVYNPQVSEVDALRGLTKLRSLDLLYTSVSDLEPLAGLTDLRTLNLASSHVADLGPVAGLTGLQSLNLDHCPVSDLDPLADLTELRSLVLSKSGVADVSPLAGLASLQTLNLDDTQVTDLRPLSRLASLQSLSLRGTPVADLTPLYGLSGLRRVDLRGIAADWNGPASVEVIR